VSETDSRSWDASLLDLAAGGLERDDRALDRAGQGVEPGVGSLLGVGVDRELDAAALVGVVAEQVDQLGHEQARVLAGEHLVLGLLDAGLAEVGEVAGDRRVAERQRVGALELEPVVARHALGDRVAPDQDRAALAGVGGLVVEGVGLPELQVGGVEHQGHEQQQAEHRDGADRLVHERLTA
jgi:hypothetical protein